MVAGSQSDQIICHVDFMATCADILGVKLPETAAEDSVSILPILFGLDNASHREAVVRPPPERWSLRPQGDGGVQPRSVRRRSAGPQHRGEPTAQQPRRTAKLRRPQVPLGLAGGEAHVTPAGRKPRECVQHSQKGRPCLRHKPDPPRV